MAQVPQKISFVMQNRQPFTTGVERCGAFFLLDPYKPSLATGTCRGNIPTQPVFSATSAKKTSKLLTMAQSSKVPSLNGQLFYVSKMKKWLLPHLGIIRSSCGPETRNQLVPSVSTKNADFNSCCKFSAIAVSLRHVCQSWHCWFGPATTKHTCIGLSQ